LIDKYVGESYEDPEKANPSVKETLLEIKAAGGRGMCSNGTENGYKDVNILHFYSRSFYPTISNYTNSSL